MNKREDIAGDTAKLMSGIGQAARAASRVLALATTAQKNQALTAAAKAIRANTPAAQVFVDEDLRGETPLELELRPGPHVVRVRRIGYFEQTWSVSTVPGEEYERDLILEIQPEQKRREEAVFKTEKRWYSRMVW